MTKYTHQSHVMLFKHAESGDLKKFKDIVTKYNITVFSRLGIPVRFKPSPGNETYEPLLKNMVLP